LVFVSVALLAALGLFFLFRRNKTD